MAAVQIQGGAEAPVTVESTFQDSGVSGGIPSQHRPRIAPGDLKRPGSETQTVVGHKCCFPPARPIACCSAQYLHTLQALGVDG